MTKFRAAGVSFVLAVIVLFVGLKMTGTTRALTPVADAESASVVDQATPEPVEAPASVAEQVSAQPDQRELWLNANGYQSRLDELTRLSEARQAEYQAYFVQVESQLQSYDDELARLEQENTSNQDQLDTLEQTLNDHRAYFDAQRAQFEDQRQARLAQLQAQLDEGLAKLEEANAQLGQ